MIWPGPGHLDLDQSSRIYRKLNSFFCWTRFLHVDSSPEMSIKEMKFFQEVLANRGKGQNKSLTLIPSKVLFLDLDSGLGKEQLLAPSVTRRANKVTRNTSQWDERAPVPPVIGSAHCPKEREECGESHGIKEMTKR